MLSLFSSEKLLPNFQIAFRITDASGVATKAVSLSSFRCNEQELLIRDKGVRNLSTNSFLL
jgi:hypothetical protein